MNQYVAISLTGYDLLMHNVSTIVNHEKHCTRVATNTQRWSSLGNDTTILSFGSFLQLEVNNLQIDRGVESHIFAKTKSNQFRELNTLRQVSFSPVVAYGWTRLFVRTVALEHPLAIHIC